jgi:hypothetical protein
MGVVHSGINDLVSVTSRIRTVVNSTAAWDVKYGIIFNGGLYVELRKLCEDLTGYTFRWNDPDGSYEDDVRALDRGIDALLESFGDLIPPPG